MKQPAPHSGSYDLILRDVVDDDLATFFVQQLDPDANTMAAFTTNDPANRDTFTAHWNRMSRDPTVIITTIVVAGRVVGYVSSYEKDGQPEVTYWLGKAYWGQGIATRALATFLQFVDWLSDIRYRQPRLYDLMPQPLVLGLIQPVLEAWSYHEPNNPVPFRWLGLWLAQKEAVVHALQLDPYDQPARIHTITEQISHLGNATHHLPHYYIGSAASDIYVVKDVKVQILYVQDVAVQGRMKEKVEYYQQLIQDWLRFQQEDGRDFLQWCHQHGRTYTWVTAWYYQP